ncbi:uncharacterized protein LOC119692312 [Plutella xylostella]|uniref:uncharacterized protein LOC119692312 n=1 Tax=Plutella xylostella TaxID=51655 RepID=UPI002032E453|nr:uncharacterized protein LOC119692312 [Plutella xylostella]
MGSALLAPLALAPALAAGAGAAALANCALLAALYRRSSNGLFSILIQLMVADVILLVAVISPEIWTFNSRTWSFGFAGCVVYKGTDVFASTASLYFIVTLALHCLATLDLETREELRRRKRSSDVEDEEVRSSRHSLVAPSDSSTPRGLRVPSGAARRVAVRTPSACVWVLAASLSVPQLVMATTRARDHATHCYVTDASHRLNIHTMLAVFNLIFPAFIFCVIIALAIAKLKAIKRLAVIDNEETVAAVKLSLYLIIVYVVMCAPRSVLTMLGVLASSQDDVPAAPSASMAVLSLAFTCVYLAALMLRPVLCILTLPRLRKIFTIGAKNVDVDEV